MGRHQGLYLRYARPVFRRPQPVGSQGGSSDQLACRPTRGHAEQGQHQDWDFAMTEMQNARSSLKSMGEELGKAAPDIWNQEKDRVARPGANPSSLRRCKIQHHQLIPKKGPPEGGLFIGDLSHVSSVIHARRVSPIETGGIIQYGGRQGTQRSPRCRHPAFENATHIETAAFPLVSPPKYEK